MWLRYGIELACSSNLRRVTNAYLVYSRLDISCSAKACRYESTRILRGDPHRLHCAVESPWQPARIPTVGRGSRVWNVGQMAAAEQGVLRRLGLAIGSVWYQP